MMMMTTATGTGTVVTGTMMMIDDGTTKVNHRHSPTTTTTVSPTSTVTATAPSLAEEEEDAYEDVVSKLNEQATSLMEYGHYDAAFQMFESALDSLRRIRRKEDHEDDDNDDEEEEELDEVRVVLMYNMALSCHLKAMDIVMAASQFGGYGDYYNNHDHHNNSHNETITLFQHALKLYGCSLRGLELLHHHACFEADEQQQQSYTMQMLTVRNSCEDIVRQLKHLVGGWC